MSTSFFSAFSSNTPAPRWDNLKSNLSPSVRQHVQRVYTNLALMLATSVVGSCLFSAGILTGGLWSLILCVGCMLGFSFVAPTPANDTLRKGLLYGFALTKGLSLGPLIEYTRYANPSSLPLALSGTALIFGCFSVSVLMSPTRNALYTRGLLASGSMVLLMLSLVNMFSRSSKLFTLELYGGLMLFAGYVIYDTQIMIAKAELGMRDYMRSSMELYVDIVAMFVHIVMILNRKEEERDRKRRNEKRR
ncbi:inhibitor of apoptosis-promoting Bax1-domain-containing protein [Phlyctochytrium arcticum]|nr:inhibitor of apoptosis-promoting Bax1-domain-containing protein [Phlyctochytrium arcticum]